MKTGEQYLAIPALTTALRAAGVTVNEDFVARLLASGAPHVTRRHRALAQPSRVLAWWKARPPGFTPGAETTEGK